jgi:hypothetical protein
MAQFTELNIDMSLVVGPQSKYDGSIIKARGDKQGSLVVTNNHGKYYEAASRGGMFSVCNQAGVTSQAGISATTPVLTLYNPAGSGYRAALIYAGATFTVAPASVGVVFLCANTNVAAAAVTGTATTAHRNGSLGAAGPKISPLLAATLPAAPVAIDILGTNYTGAITTSPQNQTLEKWYDGVIVIEPGTAISIQTGVASGASGLFCSYIWEEIMIVN